jgi:hypothetical protein
MSEIKVNKLSPRTNCGTVQLGDSGDTITIPAGATITNNGTAAGFGATGAASWDTTVKTTGFTAVSGVGYFVNTTSGAITVTLPASPSAGDVVAVKDYANTFDTNNVTLARNGSNIGGSAIDGTLSTEGLAVTLVYVDATKGWLVTDSGLQSEAPTAQYITATGGTITCSGDYKIHTFTGPGTFCVSCAGNAQGSNSVDYLVVAGGGSAGSDSSGGGGAGGYRESSGAASGCYSASPLGACVSATPVSVQGYPIVVGGGGSSGENPGSNSSALGITSTGGGFGSGNSPDEVDSGGPGGSGGAARGNSIACTTGGSGNTPPVSPPQGNNGGSALGSGVPGSGGGGGATQAGDNASFPVGGEGGDGATTSISGSPTAYAGGGGGASDDITKPYGSGGAGGGGNALNPIGENGTANTGGGAGGGRCTGGSGGSGIVIIRYKFQN